MKLLQKLTKEQIDPYFFEWEKISVELSQLHSQRNKHSKEAAQTGIELYNHLLAHCRNALQNSGFEPLNGSERLSFIKASPGSYAAYRQLDELFTELKKAIARKRIEFKHLNE